MSDLNTFPKETSFVLQVSTVCKRNSRTRSAQFCYNSYVQQNGSQLLHYFCSENMTEDTDSSIQNEVIN